MPACHLQAAGGAHTHRCDINVACSERLGAQSSLESSSTIRSSSLSSSSVAGLAQAKLVTQSCSDLVSLLLPALSAMSSGPVYVRTPWNNCRLAQFVPKARRVRGETPEQLQEKDRQREDMVDVVNMMSSNPALGSALKPIAVSMVERWRAEQGINPMGPHLEHSLTLTHSPHAHSHSHSQSPTHLTCSLSDGACLMMNLA